MKRLLAAFPPALRLAWLGGLLGLLAALGGCASLDVKAVRVDTPNPAPQALVGAKVQVQAAPGNAEGPLADTLQSAVLDAMTRAGMVPLLGAPAPYAARYAYHSYVDFEASFPSAWPPPGAPILLPDGAWIHNGYPLWWTGWSWPPPWYERVFELEIRDVASGALVWRSSALLGGYDARIAPVARELADAALAGFPQASGKRKVLAPPGP